MCEKAVFGCNAVDIHLIVVECQTPNVTEVTVVDQIH